VLPTILSQLLEGKKELSLGRIDTRRDLTFVADTVDGFVRACTAPGIEGQTVQLGTGRAESIADVLAIAQKLLGTRATVKLDERRVRPDASEVLVLQSDPAVAKATLGWTPRHSLEDGVAATIVWLRAHLDRYRTDFLHL